MKLALNWYNIKAQMVQIISGVTGFLNPWVGKAPTGLVFPLLTATFVKSVFLEVNLGTSLGASLAYLIFKPLTLVGN